MVPCADETARLWLAACLPPPLAQAPTVLPCPSPLRGPPPPPPPPPARAGVLYNTTIVPCPVSLAVINMGLQEAKVECLFSEFVQLR